MNINDACYQAVIICARYGDQGNERQKLALAWEQEIRSCIEDDKRKLTGLQFIFPGVTLFYIEGLEDDLNECIRLLNTLANKQMYGLNKIKIVHFLHNLRAPLLGTWSYKILDPAIRNETSDQEEHKTELLKMILQIVSTLSKQPPLTVKKSIENLAEKMSRSIPDSAMLETILRDGTLMDTYQYIQMVLNQRGIILDSEIVWPVPKLIYKY
ncbi:testis-expressed protein 47 [Eurytemora carolleeae]|uniref:testis-expressed protein 47 n=1 Tax=Eurytemora carolleeae TaxID=1294199 RepID=UPI000C784F6A|nr:testis-expressed protein 47 [Eurytemora carolleeae]|eukprot:XP_023333198.1 testis-expressed protein 47-like [Eurytemora affinis]